METGEIEKFWKEPIEKKVKALFLLGTCITSIRYYGYKVNLYEFHGCLLEVFIRHKDVVIDRIEPLDFNCSRMKFYTDQIILPNF